MYVIRRPEYKMIVKSFICYLIGIKLFMSSGISFSISGLRFNRIYLSSQIVIFFKDLLKNSFSQNLNWSFKPYIYFTLSQPVKANKTWATKRNEATYFILDKFWPPLPKTLYTCTIICLWKSTFLVLLNHQDS